MRYQSVLFVLVIVLCLSDDLLNICWRLKMRAVPFLFLNIKQYVVNFKDAPDFFTSFI